MALPLQLAKRMVRLSQGKYKLIKPDFFGDKDRVIFPVEVCPQRLEREIKNSEVYDGISELFDKWGYSIESYIDGTVTDTDSNNKSLKLGKILQKAGKSNLLEMFKSDPFRIYNGVSIVISRHPYDIAGMSTGRDWTSCMTYDKNSKGSYNYYVRNDIHGGTLIAYLIKSNDTNIKNPLSRMLLKRYDNFDTGHCIYNAAAKTYGAGKSKYFEICVNEILEKINEKAPEGIYTLDDKTYYSDEDIKEIDTRSDSTKNSQHKLEFDKFNKVHEENYSQFVDLYNSSKIENSYKLYPVNYSYNFSNWLTNIDKFKHEFHLPDVFNRLKTKSNHKFIKFIIEKLKKFKLAETEVYSYLSILLDTESDMHILDVLEVLNYIKSFDCINSKSILDIIRSCKHPERYSTGENLTRYTSGNGNAKPEDMHVYKDSFINILDILSDIISKGDANFEEPFRNKSKNYSNFFIWNPFRSQKFENAIKNNKDVRAIRKFGYGYYSNNFSLERELREISDTANHPERNHVKEFIDIIWDW